MSRLSSVTFRALLRGICVVRPSTRSVLHRRPYCQNISDMKPKVAANETFTGHNVYRNPKRPTDFDKRVLVWSGRFKKEEDIPEIVSWETISAARSNVRIKVCMLMILFTVTGCVFMVWSGKKALKEENTLKQINAEKKAKWKEEAMQQSASLKSH
ncbi:protein FAM162A-like [Pseudophryne corroboree]|uniref:protein FAM162A-like n=1 Tax=Pseudophryne corroboree TaxID=495146 RepID=UPI0030820404